MKIKFCSDNGANIHSQRTDTFDLEKNLGITKEEWNEMTDTEKDEVVYQWAMENFSYWWEEA